MATINVLQKCIDVCRKTNIVPFVWGIHGVGKSSMVRQYAESNGLGFIDMRCSQMEGVDLRGMMVERGDRTGYLVPQDLPVGDMSYDEYLTQLAEVIGLNRDDYHDNAEVAAAINKRLQEADHATRTKFSALQKKLQYRLEQGILFLDELNRAQDDVLQAVFQLVLDRSVGHYVLPDGWSVVVAGNYTEGYIVNNFTDPAFLDRFCHLRLTADSDTANEWAAWMAEQHGEAVQDIITFSLQNLEHLDGKSPQQDFGFNITPSRRSWDSVARITKLHKQDPIDKDVYIELLAGLIGTKLAISFVNTTYAVRPVEILRDGVAKHAEVLKKLKRHELMSVVWGCASYAKHCINSDERTVNICLDIVEFILDNAHDRDIAVAFCKTIMADAMNDQPDRIQSSLMSNPTLAKMVTKYGGGNEILFLKQLSKRERVQELLHDVFEVREDD